MNTVQYLNEFVDRRLIQKIFIKFSNKYGNLWTSRLGANGDWKGCEDDWLQELSAFTVRDAISAIKKALVIYTEFPPTQGQLVSLCLTESGVPEVQEVIRLMIGREFSHPLVKLVYDKIGSWTLANGKSDEIERKTKECYAEALANFRISPKQSWVMLESFNQKPKELPEIPKIPSQSERKSFKERFAEYQQQVEDAKLNCKGQTYREFDENAINPNSKYFDKNVYEEFRNYLLSIPEEKTVILPAQYAYQRIRLIGQKEQDYFLRKAGYNPNPQDNEKPARRVSNGPQRVYKNWSYNPA